MTKHGSAVFWWTSGILVSGVISPCLFTASYLNILSGLVGPTLSLYQFYHVHIFRVYCVLTKCVSPWYNLTGWLGVKHLVAYLLIWNRMRPRAKSQNTTWVVTASPNTSAIFCYSTSLDSNCLPTPTNRRTHHSKALSILFHPRGCGDVSFVSCLCGRSWTGLCPSGGWCALQWCCRHGPSPVHCSGGPPSQQLIGPGGEEQNWLTDHFHIALFMPCHKIIYASVLVFCDRLHFSSCPAHTSIIHHAMWKFNTLSCWGGCWNLFIQWHFRHARLYSLKYLQKKWWHHIQNLLMGKIPKLIWPGIWPQLASQKHISHSRTTTTKCHVHIMIQHCIILC